MDAKDLRTETALSDRTKDGNTKYTQDSPLQQCNRNKAYQDIGSSSLGKVDAQTVRPCAVIGPDRVVPPPAAPDAYLKKSPLEPWPCVDAYRRSIEHPHKVNEYHLPNRNISPRQTFQENMQRIMLPPSYNLTKMKDNFPSDPNITNVRNTKLNLPTEAKYCEVPYAVNSAYSEQKTSRSNDVNVPLNAGFARSGPHGWPPSSVMRSSKPYGAPEMFQYPDSSNCGTSRPMFMPGPHRPLHEESSHMYPDPYYQEGNIRFKPYPSVKDRVQQVRYEYLGNYSAPFQPSQFQNHKHDLQKSIPPHPYSGYPQVPVKYLDTRMAEPSINAYQRPINQQLNCNNVSYRNPIMHPSYAPVPGNLHPNKFYPYPSENPVKNIPMTRLPYDTNNKPYMEYDNFRSKQYAVPEGYYFNESRSHPIKGQVLPPPNFPVTNVQRARMPMPYYRTDNPSMKGYEYSAHFRNFDPTLMNLHGNNAMSRLPSQFSPNNIAMSPSDSITSNETSQAQTLLQEDAGYVSQSSTASMRSTDTSIHRMQSDPHGRYDYRYGVHIKHSQMPPKSENTAGSKNKKDIDVRQFLEMWNEGEDDGSENNKDVIHKHVSTNDAIQQSDTRNQEQLYVLGLVNVPSEELGKYEHIEKVSKLPENIKGYNSIELLNQFEEVIESSKLNTFSPKMCQSRDTRLPMRNSQTLHGINVPSQVVNVRPHGIHFPPRPLSPLDVEAKISQSVIHKEVGCNFEIKPCSPKILNVEIAAPVQTLLGERVIEKVSNPVTVPLVLPNVGELESCNATNLSEHMSSDENIKAPSCKMINNAFSDNLKTNYSVHDLESNSGVCLASLPRLDNDCELNFPEVNQQFINANKETVITSTLKDMPKMDINPPNLEKRLDLQMPPVSDTGKGICKLSQYRKSRNKPESEDKPYEVISQSLRTDSVIIKNPENTRNYEETPENPTLYEKRLQLPAQSPMNLTLHDEDRVNNAHKDCNKKEVKEARPNVTSAIDYSSRSNDVIDNSKSAEINESNKYGFNHETLEISNCNDDTSLGKHCTENTQNESINAKIDVLLTSTDTNKVSEVSNQLSISNKTTETDFMFGNSIEINESEGKNTSVIRKTAVKDEVAQEITTDISEVYSEVVYTKELESDINKNATTIGTVDKINEKILDKSKKLIPGTEFYEEDFSEISGMTMITCDVEDKTKISKKYNLFNKEIFSPQVQLLLLHTEGPCTEFMGQNSKSAELMFMSNESKLKKISTNESSDVMDHADGASVCNEINDTQSNLINTECDSKLKEYSDVNFKSDTSINHVDSSDNTKRNIESLSSKPILNSLQSCQLNINSENNSLHSDREVCVDTSSEIISSISQDVIGSPKKSELSSVYKTDNATIGDSSYDKINKDLIETVKRYPLELTSNEEINYEKNLTIENKNMNYNLESSTLSLSKKSQLIAEKIKPKLNTKFKSRSKSKNKTKPKVKYNLNQTKTILEVKSEINTTHDDCTSPFYDKSSVMKKTQLVEENSPSRGNKSTFNNLIESRISENVNISSGIRRENKNTSGTEDKNNFDESKFSTGDENKFSMEDKNRLSLSDVHKFSNKDQDKLSNEKGNKFSTEDENKFSMEDRLSLGDVDKFCYEDQDKLSMKKGNKFNMEDENKFSMEDRLSLGDVDKFCYEDQDKLSMKKGNKFNMEDENKFSMEDKNRLSLSDVDNFSNEDQDKPSMEKGNKFSTEDENKFSMEDRLSLGDVDKFCYEDQDKLSMKKGNKFSTEDENKFSMEDKNRLSLSDVDNFSNEDQDKLSMENGNKLSMEHENKFSMEDENRLNLGDVDKFCNEDQDKLSKEKGNKFSTEDENKFSMEDKNRLSLGDVDKFCNDDQDILSIENGKKFNATYVLEKGCGEECKKETNVSSEDDYRFSTRENNKFNCRKVNELGTENENKLKNVDEKDSTLSMGGENEISSRDINKFIVTDSTNLRNGEEDNTDYKLEEAYDKCDTIVATKLSEAVDIDSRENKGEVNSADENLSSQTENKNGNIDNVENGFNGTDEINISKDDETKIIKTFDNVEINTTHDNIVTTHDITSNDDCLHACTKSAIEVVLPSLVSEESKNCTENIITNYSKDNHEENKLSKKTTSGTEKQSDLNSYLGRFQSDVENYPPSSNNADSLSFSDSFKNSESSNIISTTRRFNDVYNEYKDETLQFMNLPEPISPSNLLDSDEFCEFKDYRDNCEENTNIDIVEKKNPPKENEDSEMIKKIPSLDCQSEANSETESLPELNENSCESKIYSISHGLCSDLTDKSVDNLIHNLDQDENTYSNVILDAENNIVIEPYSEEQENCVQFSIDNEEIILPICDQQTDLISNDVEEKFQYTKTTNVEPEYSRTLYSSRKRKILKRSLSDSALNMSFEDSHDVWADKRKRTVAPEPETEQNLFTENFSINLINHNRRNSVSSFYTDENVSFCILIDDNCIIAEENEEEKICFAEVPEEYIECHASEAGNSNDCITLESEVLNVQNSEIPSYSNSITMDNSEEERVLEESWFDDVACVETVVSEDISDDIIVSAQSSPMETDLSDDDVEKEYDNEIDKIHVSMNYHSDKVKHIYGDKMCSNDADFVETLYRTPQMNMNKTLIHKDADDNVGYYNSESLEEVLSDSINKEQSVSSVSVNMQKRKENVSSVPSFDEEKEDTNLDSESIDEDEKMIKTQDDTVNSCESSVDQDYRQKESTSVCTVVSSSPEVSSTTEEKNSAILLKITNYGGSRIAEVNNISQEETKRNSVSCKYTEKREYLNYNNNMPRPLITKAAQKYIPPIEETVKDLKVKLRLPQKSLNKLKLLKVSKEEPKLNPNKSKVSNKEIPKKPKPKFEDVLKSIDEIQYKMHKEKSKKVKKIIPKVVIKKSENGSHYASTTDRKSTNPDLTGQKWQPWVFLERNTFIDKMATKNKTKAVYSHRKNTYILAETFKKYKSASGSGGRDAKHSFVISQQTINDTSGNKLKYTIRLKPTY